MGTDKNSSRMRWKLHKTNTTAKHISDSTTQVVQDHIATGVLLVLGTNTQPSELLIVNSELFKTKVSTIHMVQHSPFTGKKDPNLLLEAFVQLCQIFDEDGVTQDQMRERLFPF
jgi:hypothetical protein